MTRAAVVLLAAAALLGPSQQLPPRDGVPQPTSGTGTIRGRVVTAANGDPVRNARVGLSAGRRLPPLLTDRDGRFACVNTPAGDYTVTVSKAGFATSIVGDGAQVPAARPIHLGTDEVVDVVFELARGAAIAGTVVDDTGEPVSGASVMLEAVADSHSPTRTPTLGMTDESGRYRIGSLPAGAVRVSVFSAARSVVMAPGGGILFASDDAGRRIYYPGGLKSERGEPMSLEPGDEKLGIDFVVPADVPAGPRVAPPERGSTGATGRILATDGRPIPGAQVLLLAVDAPQSAPRSTLSDADGAYQFLLPGDSAGTFRIAARRAGYVQGIYGQRATVDLGTDVTIASATVATDLDIILARPAVLMGRIFDENGDPVEGAAVRALTIRRVDGRRTLAPVPAVGLHTDDLGRYRISGLPGGDYVVASVVGQITGTDVSVDLPGYAVTYYPGTPDERDAQFISVRSAQEAGGVDFSLVRTTTQRIAGRALDAEGDPVGGGISLRPSRRSGVTTPVAAGARIERDGRFEFTNVPAGEYVLQFSRHKNGAWNEGETASLFVTVADADITDLDVHLSPGSTVAGRIVVEGGGNVTPDSLEISPVVLDPDLSPTFGPPARALIGDDLRFELAGLRGPRRLRLTRGPAGFALKAIRVHGSDVSDAVLPFGRPNQSLDDVEVVLTNRVTEISGTVADARGRRASNVTVVAFAVDASLRYARSRFLAAVTCDREGAFRLAALPPGDYYVAAYDKRQVGTTDGEIDDLDVLETFVAGSQRVALAEGQRATLSLTVGGR